MASSGLSSWQLSYQISPITLVGGIATNMGGGMLPILNLLQPTIVAQGGPGSSEADIPLEDYFAHFEPLAGSSLFRASWPKYPLANQYIAANAGVSEELTVSLLMKCPARPEFATWAQKLAIITALKNSLAKHFALGGTYNVATPSVLYTGLLLSDVRDVSAGESEQPQTTYQWDFEQPLITQQQAAAAQGVLLSRITAGGMVPNDPPTNTGAAMTIGQPPTGAASTLVTNAQNLLATSASGQGPSSAGGNGP